MLGNLIGGFIVIVVGVNLIPSVADSVQAARFNASGDGAANLTSSASTILSLTPLFFALGIMSAGVALTVGGLRNAGVM